MQRLACAAKRAGCIKVLGTEWSQRAVPRRVPTRSYTAGPATAAVNGAGACAAFASDQTEGKSAIGDDESNLACASSEAEMASVVEMDTWSWVNAAMAADARLSRAQCEALVDAVARIASYRLATWQAAETTPRDRLYHALHTSSERVLDACRRHGAALTAAEAEARAVAGRIAAEVAAAGDALRDTAAGVRTDTALSVAALRAEGREAVQRAEGEVHRLRGELAAAVAAFRAGSEHTKARATSLFTAILGVSLLLIVVERTVLA